MQKHLRKDLAPYEHDDIEEVNNESDANMIEEICDSFQFMQMQIYTKNQKYEKSLALIEQLLEEYEEQGEPNTLLFLYKQKYKVQVNIERLANRDAELTLQNSIALIERHMGDF